MAVKKKEYTGVLLGKGKRETVTIQASNRGQAERAMVKAHGPQEVEGARMWSLGIAAGVHEKIEA